MEVILVQDVEKLGKAGSVVKVKDGFAQNFLFPHKLAVPCSAQNLQKLQQEKQRKDMELEKAKKQAEELKEKLSHLSLTLPVLVHEADKVYGSVTAAEIQGLLKEEGFDIEKNSIVLEEPIKALGIFEVPVKLHPEITATVKIWVVKK